MSEASAVIPMSYLQKDVGIFINTAKIRWGSTKKQKRKLYYKIPG